MSAPAIARRSEEREPDTLARLFAEIASVSPAAEGVTRLAYSRQESDALDIIEREARLLGLHVARDPAANLVATLPGAEPDLPAIACGSHIDSVPQGGNFDGAAGVLAALVVLARLSREAPMRRTVRLYALRGEESARFGKPYLGSSALLGRLTTADLDLAAENDGRSLRACMADVGVDVCQVEEGRALVDPTSLAAWIELHIEQGPVLVARELPVGIVTGIRGNIRHRAVECVGQAGHSGTVPRWLRRDPVFGMSELIVQLDSHWRTLLERGHDLVMTSGIVATDPRVHAIARIPDSVRFAFELRSQSAETLESAYSLFRAECEAVGRERGLSFRLDQKVVSAGALMDPDWVERLTQAAGRVGVASEPIPSGAGHDAAVFANAGVPSAMVFVRNQNGSHNPREAMDIADLIAGIDVMHDAIREAASE